MEAFFRLLPGPQSLLVRYGATTLMVLFAFALRLEIEDRAGDMQIAKRRGLGSCGAVHIVEQLLPDGPHLLVDNETTANKPSGPAAS